MIEINKQIFYEDFMRLRGRQYTLMERGVMMKKRVSVVLIAALILAFPLTTMAGTSSSTYGSYKLTANCGSASSWYQVTGGSYPKGTGTFVYYNGTVQKTVTVAGTTYSGYWYGSKSATGTSIRTVKATTKYNTYTVTAVP